MASRTVRLRSAMLVSPVWANNFGESMLGTFHALHAHEPSEALLVAISAAVRRRQWARYRHFGELLSMTWPGAALHTADRGVEYHVANLSVCHLHDAFDDGRRAFQGMQLSVLGATARQQHLRQPTRSRPRRPVRLGVAMPSRGKGTPNRTLHNADELVREGCAPFAPNVSCEIVHLDHAGCHANLQAVLPLHALVALHGAHVTYAAFPERPFALLEVRPYTMTHTWFRKYHQTAFALDTWTYSFEAGEAEHRKSKSGEAQRQGAVLPVGVFREFVGTVLRRFDHAAKKLLVRRPAAPALTQGDSCC